MDWYPFQKSLPFKILLSFVSLAIQNYFLFLLENFICKYFKYQKLGDTPLFKFLYTFLSIISPQLFAT